MATNIEMVESSKALSTQAQLLFAQVQFYIVASPGLEGEPADSVCWVLMICPAQS